VDQADAGAIGQPVIDQINVVLVGLDALEARRHRRRDLDDALEVRVHERHLDERQSLRVVVHDQQTEMA
jgi:hypothetical protein